MGDTKKRNEFEGKLEQIFSCAFTSLNIMTGLEVGLFESLSNFKEPKTYTEVAEHAKLKPRYVKELLGCLTVSGIVEIDPETEKYYLPEYRREYFDKSKPTSSIVQYMELVPIIGTLREKVAKCYELDGPKGVSSEHYKEFSSHMSKVSGLRVNNQLVSYIEKVDGLTKKLENGAKCLDLACGTGHTTVVMAERFPQSKFIGGDLIIDQLEVGQEIGKSRNLSNMTLQKLDFQNLPDEWSRKFDFVLCHMALHDLGNPDKGLKEFWRVLKDSGIGLIVDVNVHSKHSQNVGRPCANIEYGFSEVKCLPSSLSFENGWGLGACWGVENASEFIRSHRFDIRVIENGSEVLYVLTKCV